MSSEPDSPGLLGHPGPQSCPSQVVGSRKLGATENSHEFYNSPRLLVLHLADTWTQLIKGRLGQAWTPPGETLENLPSSCARKPRAMPGEGKPTLPCKALSATLEVGLPISLPSWRGPSKQLPPQPSSPSLQRALPPVLHGASLQQEVSWALCPLSPWKNRPLGRPTGQHHTLHRTNQLPLRKVAWI